MKTSLKSITTAALGTAAWLVVGTSNAQPQDRPQQGNFDPQQMRQRMLDRMREQFDVKDDTEWKAISARIEKVMQARRNVGGSGGPGGFGFPGGRAGQSGSGGPPPQGGQGGPDGFGPPSGGAQRSPAESQGAGGFRNGPGGSGREASPELEALRKAIENKASAAEIKAKLADLRAARKKKAAELEQAQDELCKILSARQEAVAVTLGLLN